MSPIQRPRLASRLVFLAVCLATGPAEAAPPFVADDTALDAQACGSSGCWSNYMRALDLDGDSDLDLIFANYAGFFESGTAEPLALYINDGSGGFALNSAVALGGHQGKIRQVGAGDIDGDGDIDLIAPDGGGGPDAVFINDGAGVFGNEAAQRWPVGSSRAGAVRLADVDDDGDLDVFVAAGYAQGAGAQRALHLYLNDGAGNFTDASEQLPASFEGIDADDIDVFDADRDFDLDVMLNMHAGDNNLWLNDGTGNFSDASGGLAAQRDGFHYNPGVCDVDGDGDLDLWIDNMGPGYAEQLLINQGGAVFVDETAARVSGNDGSDDNGVACADVDQDGDFDAVIWSLGSTERVLINDGSGVFSLASGVFEAVADPTLWGDLGDFDGDGRLDAATAQGEGNPDRNLVYRGSADGQVDARAPAVTHQQGPPSDVAPDQAVALRFAVRDAVVTDSGPRVVAFARLEVEGTATQVDASFSGGDLYRVVIPGQAVAANVSVTLCARDEAGNEGCGAAQSWTVQAGGSEGSEAETGASQGADESGASAGPTAGESSSDAGGSGESGGSGCACAATDRGSQGLGGLLCLCLWAGRRRRQRNPRR